MKKITAIFLLVIFSFNNFGYKLVYQYFLQQSDTKLELAIDKDAYNDADLISIKQATNLPYYNNSHAFQRIDGEVKIDGIIYKYVKCRIYNDSLEMLCISHKAKMTIESSKDQFSKLVNDFQQSDNKKKPGDANKTLKGFTTEFTVSSYKNDLTVITTSETTFSIHKPSLPLNCTMEAERPPIFQEPGIA